MFSGKVERVDFHKMPREYQELLIRVITIQADCEIGGAHLYADRWLFRAPTADDQYRLARIVAEEIDHFRKFGRIVEDLGVDVSVLLWRDWPDRMVDSFRTGDMETWADLVVFGALVDRVGRCQVEEYTDCSYLPLARCLPPIIREEVAHVAFATAKLRELCADPAGQQDAQRALERWYPQALDMFGRSGSWRSERYVDWGIKRRTNEQARLEFIREVTPLLRELGLTVPDERLNRKYL